MTQDYFSIQHALSVNIEPVSMADVPANLDVLNTEMPIPFKMANEVANIDTAALRSIRNLSEQADALADFLQLQNEKIKQLQDSNDKLKIRADAQEVTIKRLNIELDGTRKSSPPQFSPYQLLGITAQSDNSEIKKQYRKLVQLHHPDHGTDGVMLAEINKAYNQIK